MAETGTATGRAGEAQADFIFITTPDRATGFGFTPLPRDMVVLGVSQTGVVALRDEDNYYRWSAGVLMRLAAYFTAWNSTVQSGDTTFQTQTELTLAFDGTIAITNDLSSYRRVNGTHEVDSTINQSLKIWPVGGNIPRSHPAQSYTAIRYFTDDSPPPQQTFTSNQHTGLAFADGGMLWCLIYSGTRRYTMDNLQYQEWQQSLVRIAPDGTVTTMRRFDTTLVDFMGVSAAGVPIGSWYDLDGVRHHFVGDDEVDYEPLAISRGGQVLGYADDQEWVYRAGKPPKAVPAEGFGFWWDAQERLNGFVSVNNQVKPALWLETGPDGVWQAYAYTKLELPPGWSSSTLVPPGSSGPQVGLATDAQGDHPFLAMPNLLAVDANRDGEIHLAGEILPLDKRDTATADQPYRFWINDDNDSGDMGGDDIPGKTADANYADGGVNGTRDLVDFFPAFLDIKQLLATLPPGASVKYKLKQADDALNFVYTNLARDTKPPRDGALAYQKKILNTGFGPDFNQAAGAATTQQITSTGVELSAAFLAGVKDSDWGVLLLEGRAATTAPLVLAVEKDGTSIIELKLELRVSNVEDMFRHIDLTGVLRAYDGSAVAPPVPAAPARARDPGSPYPDSATNGKYFVFVHGFNVDGQRARGWNAEIFKRLYQMGSHARFVGVTWNGATGVQLPNGSYTDYHQAVFNAFQTGDELAARLTSNGVTGDVTIAAHSLGNMVASQAIQYGGFSPKRYYMINAAVPVEAYDLPSVGLGDLTRMTETDWQEAPFNNGDGRLFAANWYKLFVGNTFPDGTSDHRSKLTWKRRFPDVLQNAYDFYSPGDDVVEDPTTSSPSLLVTVIKQGFSSSHGAWGLQELAKGTFSIASVFFSRTQAGWGQSITGKQSPLNANPTSDSLKIEPFFASFDETDLLNPNAITASTMADPKNQKKVQYDVLARGIPALSFATAVHPLGPLGTSRNFNMEIQGRTQNQWPTDGHTNDDRDVGRWLHSDFKNVALPYVFQMYQEMINQGALQ